MHTFIKAIGFSKKVSQVEIDALVRLVVEQADSNQVILKSNGSKFIEYKKEFGENFGIVVRGEEDEKDEFHVGHFFPYLKSTVKPIKENEVFIHKKVDSDAYTGMCDDNRLGVSLIFYLQNVVDYMKQDNKIQQVYNDMEIKLAALAEKGKIILPTQKRIYSHIASKIDKAVTSQLMDDAKNGDMEALDYLTYNDMDKNAALSERIRHEDLFSIVETCFIPYGSESDLYTVLGNIVSSKQMLNQATGETIWILRIVCNDIEFEVAINTNDLLGMPLPGMRFKGVVWMQGEVNE
ncbi:MAG: DUF3881 family protein [Lachnospiraceae bacterium]|nr:DUF3881 family protein [Lachnospiraceae bacterium]